MKFRGIEEAP